jgi:large subunit ribosomal protein L22
VSVSRIDEGPVLDRFQPKDRGRAHPIIKRMSHIHIAVEER